MASEDRSLRLDADLTKHASRLAWRRPQCSELSLDEANEVRERFRRIDRANDPLAQLTAKQIFFDCVWLSNERTATKIMLLCIGRFFDDHAQSSSMSYAQVARECGLDERTAKRIGQEVKDRWLRIGIAKGFYVPGKGRQNLYHGISPPDVVEQLREHKRKGGSIAQDERLARAADAAAERVMTGVASDHLAVNSGVAYDHPATDRGDSGARSGWQETTRTQIDSDDNEKEERGDRAHETVLDATLEEAFKAVAMPALEGELVLPAPSVTSQVEEARRVWMKDPHGIAGGHRGNLEAALARLAQSLELQGYARAHIAAAVMEAAGEMQARAADKVAQRGSGGGFVAYLTKSIRSKVAEIDKRARERQAHAATTEAATATSIAIQGKRVTAFDQAVARRADTPSPRAPGSGGTDGVVQALRADGAAEDLVKELIRPLLVAFPNHREPKEWAAEVVRGFAQSKVPVEIQQWASGDIQKSCKFLPPPQQVVDGVLERERLMAFQDYIAQLESEWETAKVAYMEEFVAAQSTERRRFGGRPTEFEAKSAWMGARPPLEFKGKAYPVGEVQSATWSASIALRHKPWRRSR